MRASSGPASAYPWRKSSPKRWARGSLREGIRALAILGIVKVRQGDGSYITSLDVSRLLAPMGFVVDLQGEGQVRHIHAIRRLLET